MFHTKAFYIIWIILGAAVIFSTTMSKEDYQYMQEEAAKGQLETCLLCTSGVSSWILETIGPRMAYLAGWTYWIVHMPYISQKPNGAVIATSLSLIHI